MLPDILNQPLFTLSGTPVTIATILTALAIILVARWVSALIQRGLTRGLKRQGVGQEGSLAAGRRLAHYATMIVGTAVALEMMGINLGALFAAGAIFAIGLGFAMQNIAQNFVAGVILLIERSIKPGDMLEVEGIIVRVVEMGIRSTLARTRDEEELIIPNSVLVQSAIKNYTLRDSLYRLRAQVGVIYGSDMALVASTLKEVADRLEWRLESKEPLVLLTGFGDSSVNFEVSVWIDDPWQARIVLSRLHLAVWWALKDVGITIAFPQLDVHFDQPIVDSARRLTGLALAE